MSRQSEAPTLADALVYGLVVGLLAAMLLWAFFATTSPL